MKTNLLAIFFTLLSAAVSLAEAKPYPSGSGENIDGSVLGLEFNSETGSYKWRPLAVDANGQLKTTGSVQVEQGEQIINVDLSTIHFDTTRIEDLLENNLNLQPKIMIMKHEYVTSNVGSYIAPFSSNPSHDNYNSNLELSGCTERVFVELRADNPEEEFLVGVNIDPTVLKPSLRPVKGRILLNLPAKCNGYPILVWVTKESESSDRFYFTVTEGWR